MAQGKDRPDETEAEDVLDVKGDRHRVFHRFAGRRGEMCRWTRAATLVAFTVAGVAASLVLVPFGISASAPTRARSAVFPLSTAEYKAEAGWRKAMSAKKQPSKGCFTAHYPALTWMRVRCVTAPKYPMAPPHGVVSMEPQNGAVPLIMGDGNDIAAQEPFGAAGRIQSATGSFPQVSPAISESGPIANGPTDYVDTYSLQINTNTFVTPACNGVAGCLGWEQFLFVNENDPNSPSYVAFIQYWLLGYGACPANPPQGTWTQYGPNCYMNSPAAPLPAGNVSVGSLDHATLTGTASAGGDSVLMDNGMGSMASVAGYNAVVASSGWTDAEFNIFGDAADNNGHGGTATFNPGASIVTRTQIAYPGGIYGGSNAPLCQVEGFTAEKNSLSFGPGPGPVSNSPGPAVIFNESTAGGDLADCAAATTVGDTHMTTFSGMLYNFQSTGDFELLRSPSGFDVQARQVTAPAKWPNAAVNTAVAARFGSTKVAVCLAPQRAIANGHVLALKPGKPKLLPGGAQILRLGNVYFIRGPRGDWVKADLETDHINVNVGLGTWPTHVSGLLVNAHGNPNQLATRGGTVLTNPFSFKEFYDVYGESWRVSPRQSLLNPCGKVKQSGRPKKDFGVTDLNRKLAAYAKAICEKEGVPVGPLLDACMIDVAFSGASAAKVYRTTGEPITVGQFIGTSLAGGGGCVTHKPQQRLQGWCVVP